MKRQLRDLYTKASVAVHRDRYIERKAFELSSVGKSPRDAWRISPVIVIDTNGI